MVAGKTTFMERHCTGKFTKKYIPTLGVEVKLISFCLSDGSTIIFNIWDCAGQEKFGGLRDGYYVGADAFMVMFDVTSRLSFNEAIGGDWWKNKLLAGKPALLLANKVDIKERKVPGKESSDKTPQNATHIEISVKSNYQSRKTFSQISTNIT